MFLMDIRAFTPQRYSIAFRSTKVTPDISRAICGAASGLNAVSNSETYSPVSCPQRYTVRALLSLRVVVIFSTIPPESGRPRLPLRTRAGLPGHRVRHLREAFWHPHQPA